MTDTETTDPTRVEVVTPFATFTLALTSGHGGSSRETTDVARRWGLPVNLAAITDVAAHPANVVDDDGGSSRAVVVNGVTYTGSGYLIARGYHIGETYTGPDADNGWTTGHGPYWTWQHCSRYTAAKGWQPVTEAASRKLSDALDSAARALLADVDAVNAYWRGHLMSARGYKLADAQRSLNDANQYAAMVRGLGGEVPDIPRVYPTDY